MKIYLNGEARELPDTTTAATLVEELGLTGKRIAMEINMEIVPRGEYAMRLLQAGDKVEVVQAIGGG